MKKKVEMSSGDLKDLHQMIDEYVSKFDKPCKKGCSYCCHQAVSIFEFERSYIRDAIKKIPPKIKEQVKKNFFIAKAHFLANVPDMKEISFTDFQNHYGKLMAADYISCPLLVDNLCSIYENRPLECSWHFVRDEPLVLCYE